MEAWPRNRAALGKRRAGRAENPAWPKESSNAVQCAGIGCPSRAHQAILHGKPRADLGEVERGLMRIAANETIAGYPALQIRQLMRETVGRSITPRYVREILPVPIPPPRAY